MCRTVATGKQSGARRKRNADAVSSQCAWVLMIRKIGRKSTSASKILADRSKGGNLSPSKADPEGEKRLAPRVILFGASNLTLLLPHLLRRGPRGTWLVHCGHGRALTVSSRFLVRGLPPSLRHGRWREVELDAVRTALVMDLGLDLLYGASFENLRDGLRDLISDLPVVPTLTAPPLESVRAIGVLRFELLRRLFFPGRSVERQHILAQLTDLANLLGEWESSGKIRLVKLDASYFGWDPIHVRRNRRGDLAHHLLGSFPEAAAREEQRLARSWRWRAWPERFTIAGFDFGRGQPCVRAGGIELWLR